MKHYKYLRIMLVFSIVLIFIQCNRDSKSGNSFYRGVVLYPSDIRSVGVITTIGILKDADLNLLGIHAEHLSNLKQNLEIFPVSTAHILEYWLDASMFSGWNKNNLTKVPWETNNFARDIRFYNDLGIRSVTCFATWMINAGYIENFGEDHIVKIIEQYGTSMEKFIN